MIFTQKTDQKEKKKRLSVSDSLGNRLLVVVETDTDFLKNDLVVFMLLVNSVNLLLEML